MKDHFKNCLDAKAWKSSFEFASYRVGKMQKDERMDMVRPSCEYACLYIGKRPEKEPIW